ncbi:MAG TPA: multidrug efflux SMR transporter [Bacillus sp. (in: firmicutes)]|nr:multidrug efflux SMR transporter [Bacillus sp. (in: firmicutes)]
MAWVYVVLAGIFEMTGVTMINKWHHDGKQSSLLLMLAGFSASFLFLSLAMKTLPMGTAYAIWTGIGASGGAIFGMVRYGESKDWRRIFFIGLILSTAIGLKAAS